MDEAMHEQKSRRSDRTRRTIIKDVLAGLALAPLAPVRGARAAADPATWPRDAFAQKNAAAAIKALYGGKTPQASDAVNLDAPEIAEDGAVVPISVSATLPDVTSIAIVLPGNPFPLAARYVMAPGTSAMVANRLKMAKTGKVLALVESGGKVFSASKEVKVTVGGCGG
jgi:sulfur-oxidizing protein SoxY